MRRVTILACLLLLLPANLAAQASPDGQAGEEIQQRMKALEDRISSLEAELRALKAAQPSAAPPPAAPAVAPQTQVQAPSGAPGVPAGPLPVYGGASALAKVLNPDVSVIGDFIGSGGRNPGRAVPTFDMHESEVGLQAIVDPYARADFFISFGEHGVDLEEGYITFTSLPASFVAKAGKMRSSFGVVNTLHNHNLPWIDRPLVTESLVGGEDGIDDAGLSVSRILPAPKGVFLEATAQVFRGDSEGVFMASRRGDVSTVGRLRGYRDLTESTNIDLGLSYARGHNDLGTAFRTQLYGLDATFRWKPLRRAIYHSFLGRTELVWSRRDQLASIQRAFGFYTSAEYRLSRRWTLGGRYDQSERAQNAALLDRGFAPVITYWPSEFSQVRGEYRFTRYADGRSGNDVLLQFIFVLGAHGAHPF